MRRAAAVDPADYLRAVGLLFKHPAIALGPLAASFVLIFSGFAMPAGGGLFSILNGMVASLFAILINSLGLSFALVAADYAWRYDRVNLSESWETVRRRIGDIFMAGLGVAFVTYFASYLGSVFGSIGLPGFALIGTLLLGAAVAFFLIYAMPAAAIGGVPGGAALNASVERARSAPLPTLVLLVVYYVTYFAAQPIVSMFAGNLLLGFGVRETALLAMAVLLVVQSVFGAYYALVLAKTYNGISYRRIW
ncbi:MAG: hypothetical protein GIW95_07490 [Candidatus Eremiobacteraeota bacterium]|nr:hypothetical protein [Candidatus Eremiobacteraeota bacterium]